MRNLKKFLALVLAMMMTLSLMVTVNASSFKDNDDVTKSYNEAVDVLSKMGVINGYSDGTFLPKEKITRAEVAAIIYRITTGDVGNKNIHLYQYKSEFTDVADGLWYVPYINYCANNGLVNGVGGNRFAPKANVTGYEALVMILRAIGYNNPTEFSSSDWKFKASGYGSRLEITKNIPAGSLGGEATREMVAEIMFKGILAPMVNYSPLTQYTTDLLVDASEVNAQYDAKLYAEDVPNTLMYQTFKFVGKRTCDNYGKDNYGRPQVEWVKDLSTDTVQNGGKYIPNYQSPAGTADTTRGGLLPGFEGAHANTWYNADTRKDSAGNELTEAGGKGVEPTAMAIPMAPVKTYHDVVTECQLMKDVNQDAPINATLNLTEYLNGGKVAMRGADTGAGKPHDDNYIVDALHTTTADSNYTVGAPGRTTEIYKYSKNGTTKWTFVYIDTFMGVVTDVTPRAFDTAGHVMVDATLSVRVNDNRNGAVIVQDSDDEADFTQKVGDLVLMQTWGLSDDVEVEVDTLQKNIPFAEKNFRWVNEKGTNLWAVDTLDDEPTTVTFTANATVGARDFKTGLISTDGNTYMGNVVYLANGSVKTDGYVCCGASSIANLNNHVTVPMTPTDYSVRMLNEDIGREFTAVRDQNGYVVGLTQAAVSEGVGVITSIDSVKIGTGKYAVEAEMFMMDGSTKTVRFLDNDPNGGAANDGFNGAADPNNTWDYFKTQGDADLSIGKNATKARNAKIDVNVLVHIKPFTLDGATYYKVLATNEGKVTDAAGSFAGGENPNGNNIITGVADSMSATVTYSKDPSVYNGDSDTANNNLDDNTKFIIAEVDYRYNNGQANEGGYTKMVYTSYKGFKTIPTIESINATSIKVQRIGNNVFIYPDVETDLDNLNYTLKSQKTYGVDKTYLVLAPVATYADHSTYKVLEDGKETTLDIVNDNKTGGINDQVEDALDNAYLISVASTNTKGYATSVNVYKTAKGSDGSEAEPHTRTFAETDLTGFDKTGVMEFSSEIASPFDQDDATGVLKFLTVADGCTVQIVNLVNGTYADGTLDSIRQYKDHETLCSFTYELDQYGYISHIYIID